VLIKNKIKNTFNLLLVTLIYCGSTSLFAQTVTLTEGTNISIALSPDQQKIAMDLQGTLWVLPATGGESVALTDYLGDVRQPNWSSDGKRIAFQSFRDGNWHIWSILADGSDLRQHTKGLYDHREPQWSADGTKILFSSDRAGNYDVWLLDVSSGETRALTNNPANDIYPSWAPNGKSIAYVSSRKENAGVYTIEFPTTGKNIPKLIYPSKMSLAGPSYSPSGTQLTVQQGSRRLGTSELVRINLLDGKASVITENQDVFPFHTAWKSEQALFYTADGVIKLANLNSSDSKVIPFSATINLDRPSYPRKKRDFDSLASQSALGLMTPAVSPDGSQVVLTALGDLWMIDQNGSHQITNDPFVQAHPSWSSDGQQIVYISDQNGNADIWTYNVDTNEHRNVISTPGADSYPVFAIDSKSIIFFEGNSLNPLSSKLTSIDVATGKKKALMKSPISATPTSIAGPDAVMVTTKNAFSSRYREGVYETLRVSLSDGSVTHYQPISNQTLSGASWSENGRHLAFIENGELYVLEFDGDGNPVGDPRKLADGPVSAPKWSADLKTLVFLAAGKIETINIETQETNNFPTAIEWTRDAGKGRTVVHAGQLFNGRDLHYSHNVDIVIEDNRIESVVPHDDSLHRGTVIDASDKTVIPGLTEMHAHQSILLGEKQGRTWLAYGITNVREPGAAPYDALERKESWNSGQRPGPREFFSGGLIDGNRVNYAIPEGISSAEHLEIALKRAKTLQYDLIKTYVRLPDIMQNRVISFAHEMGVPTSSHELFPAASTGMDAMEHMGATSRRGYSPVISSIGRSYGDVIGLLAASKMNNTPTMVFSGFGLTLEEQPELKENPQFLALYGPAGVMGLNMRIRMFSSPSSKAKRQSMGETVYGVLQAGGRITTGTDAPFFPFGFGLHIEINLLAQSGFTAFEALRSSTLWAAEAIGIDEDLGTIEAGKLADLVILDADPVKNIANTMSVSTTIKNGVVYAVEDLLKAPTLSEKTSKK